MEALYSHHVDRYARAVVHAAEEGALTSAWDKSAAKHDRFAHITRKLMTGR